MGYLSQIWNIDDGSVLYTFVRSNMSLVRDFGRRESVVSVPGMDSVLDGFGRDGGPMDRRDMPFGFRVFTNGDNDAAYDLLAAAVAHGRPVRLRYVTDTNQPWFTFGYNAKIQQTLVSENSWGYGGFCDFTVIFRIRPWWTPELSEAADVWHTAAVTFHPADDELFGNVGTTIISANPQSFQVDARGTAGFDLPTIPDTGPKITLLGPCGGDGGIQIINFNSFERDTNGTLVNTTFGLLFKLATASDSVTLDFAAQTFLHNGLPFRPNKPIDGNGASYQRRYFQIVNGILNVGSVIPLGANVVLGGSINLDWWRKRA